MNHIYVAKNIKLVPMMKIYFRDTSYHVTHLDSIISTT